MGLVSGPRCHYGADHGVVIGHYAFGVPSPASQSANSVEQAFAGGDEDALRAAYELYGALVYTYCLQSLDESRAKDVAQEVFISALRNRGQYNPQKGTLAGWLIAITKNRIIDNIRAEQRHEKRRAEADFEEVAVEAQVDKAGDRMMVAEALRCLPDRPRRVIALHYFDDLTHSQIADRLSVPIGTVKSDLRRGLLQIRRQLESVHG